MRRVARRRARCIYRGGLAAHQQLASRGTALSTQRASWVAVVESRGAERHGLILLLCARGSKRSGVSSSVGGRRRPAAVVGRLRRPAAAENTQAESVALLPLPLPLPILPRTTSCATLCPLPGQQDHDDTSAH